MLCVPTISSARASIQHSRCCIGSSARPGPAFDPADWAFLAALLRRCRTRHISEVVGKRAPERSDTACVWMNRFGSSGGFQRPRLASANLAVVLVAAADNRVAWGSGHAPIGSLM